METKEPFAVQAAKFSLWAPLLMILVNICSKVAGSTAVSTLIGFVALIVYPIGLVLGIVALTGIRKHGKEGILVRGILGIVLNGLILILAVSVIPVLAKARTKARERIAAHEAAQLAEKTAAEAYHFTPPADFVEFPAGMDMIPHLKAAFIKGDPTDDKPDVLLLIEDLGGTLGQNDDLGGVPKGHENVKLLSETWKAHQIAVFEVNESQQGVPVVTYNAQVPLLPSAIQVKIFGLKAQQEELQIALREALAGVEGQTNWK